MDLRVDIFDSLDNPDGIRASAAYVYENYGYGYGDTHEGVSLTIVAMPDENGWTVENWCVYAAGADETAVAWRENCITAAVSPFMEAEQWAGDLAQDQKAIASAVQAVAQGLEASFAEPVATETGSFIFDEAGLLTPEQVTQLESIARQMAEDVQQELERKVSGIEPAMVLICSVLVGAILLSVMLPLMNIMAALG